MSVPTLQRLAVATLIRFRDALGDIGYAPVELLQDVLAACSPQQLATIEDETLAGTGRTLKPWTWPLWREHWQKQFAKSFGAPAPAALPPLPLAAEVAEGEPGVRPADYRVLFERCQAELEQKRAESGARLRALREQADQERQARHTQVVDPGTVPGRRRRQQQSRPGGTGGGGSGGGSGHRWQAQPAGSSKERLLKKLGLGVGSSSRLAAAQPRKTVTVIRPARAPTTAGMPQRLASTAQQALPSPVALRQAMHPGLPRSPAGSLASAGSSPLAWQQVQAAARSGSMPLRQQLHPASSSPLSRQHLQTASSSSLGQQRAQQPQQQQASQQQAVQQRQQQSQEQQQQAGQQQLLKQQQRQPAPQQHAQQQPSLPSKEAGMKPQVVAGIRKAPSVELCHSELLPSRPAERPQQQALPLPPQQQQPSKQGDQAAAAAKRKPVRPARSQALEEVDLFAGVEEAPEQPQRPPQPAARPQQRAAGGGSGHGKGSSRGAQPPAKKPRQQQPAAALLEVDLFDGL